MREPKTGYETRKFLWDGRVMTETRYVHRVVTVAGVRVVEWNQPSDVGPRRVRPVAEWDWWDQPEKKKMKRLTDEEKKKYVEDGFNRCPFCSGFNVVAKSVDVDGRRGRSPVECRSCYRSWEDLWTLTGVDDSVDAEVRCDSCPWYGDQTEAVLPVPDLWERVEPGGVVPAGECPECHALVYLTKGGT